MADNTTLNLADVAGGDVLGTDDISGVKYQRVKIITGIDGTNDGDVSDTNPMPIDDAGGSLTVDGTVTANAGSGTMAISAASLPLPTSAATEATLGSVKTAVELIDNAISGTEMQVDVVASLPAGTNAIGKLAANTGVDIGDVDVTSFPGTAEADIGAIKTAVEILDNTVSGSEMQVDIVGALPAGTAAIGKLAANSGVDIGDVDVLSAPARDRTTDNVGVGLQTDVIMNDTTALTPKFAVIDAASSGDNTLVAAVVGKKIRVLQLYMVAGGDVDVRFEDGAGGTALTGQSDLTANSGFTLPFSPVGWFETSSNTLLNLELSGAISCDGCLTYVEV